MHVAVHAFGAKSANGKHKPCVNTGTLRDNYGTTPVGDCLHLNSIAF